MRTVSLKPEALSDRVGEEEPQMEDEELGIWLGRLRGTREEHDEGQVSGIYFKAGFHLGNLGRLLLLDWFPSMISLSFQIGKLRPSRKGQGVMLWGTADWGKSTESICFSHWLASSCWDDLFPAHSRPLSLLLCPPLHFTMCSLGLAPDIAHSSLFPMHRMPWLRILHSQLWPWGKMFPFLGHSLLYPLLTVQSQVRTRGIQTSTLIPKHLSESKCMSKIWYSNHFREETQRGRSYDKGSTATL